MDVLKKNIKDRGDGTIELVYEAIPGQIPNEFRYAPTRSRFVLIFNADQPLRIEAMKSTMTDPGNGRITVKLIVMAGAIPDEVIYIKNNTKLEIKIEPSNDDSESFLPLTTEERIKTLKQIAILSSDVVFIKWIAERHPFIAKISQESPELVEDAVSEAVKREIEAHSRNEILTSAIVSERAQIMMRRFRKSLWSN